MALRRSAALNAPCLYGIESRFQEGNAPLLPADLLMVRLPFDELMSNYPAVTTDDQRVEI